VTDPADVFASQDPADKPLREVRPIVVVRIEAYRAGELRVDRSVRQMRTSLPGFARLIG